MDVLRSGYSTYMYSFDRKTGAMVPFPVTWKRTKPNAKPIGIRHQYASSIYDNRLPFGEGVGEIPGDPRVWQNSQPNPVPNGINYCGAAALWRGPLYRLDSPLAVDVNGNPTCCIRTSDALCKFCSGQVGKQVMVGFITGGTVDFAPFNGLKTMLPTGPCQWSLTAPPYKYTLFVSGTEVVYSAFRIDGTAYVTYAWPVPWNCYKKLPAEPATSYLGTGVRGTGTVN